MPLLKTSTPLSAYLPQKTTTYVLAVVILAVGGLGFLYTKKREAQKEKLAGIQAKLPVAENFKIDTDGDGLKDWEELLLKTDHNKPDTDGDGTPDGDEVKEGRNPLVRGPSDRLSEEEKGEAVQKRKEGEEEIEDIFRSIFVTALSLKKNNASPDTATSTLRAVAEREMAQYSDRVVRMGVYTEKDIKISNESSPAAIRAYGNAAGALVLKNDKPLIGSLPDMYIVYLAATKNDEKILEKLDPYITYYRSLVPDLLALPAPKPMAHAHLAYINFLTAYGDGLEALKKFYTEPVVAAAALNRAESVLRAYGSAIDEMLSVFKKNNVVFVETDNGNVFNPNKKEVNDLITNAHKAVGIPLGTDPKNSPERLKNFQP